jgi:hypothetical protein
MLWLGVCKLKNGCAVVEVEVARLFLFPNSFIIGAGVLLNI